MSIACDFKRLNRKERRQLMLEQHRYVKTLSDELSPVDTRRLPAWFPGCPDKAFINKEYLVQLFDESETVPGMVRLSICRTKIDFTGNWTDRLTWDELQAIKAEVGYGDWYGLEVYPRDCDIVNVANFRHLWLFKTPPIQVGWFKQGGS